MMEARKLLLLPLQLLGCWHHNQNVCQREIIWICVRKVRKCFQVLPIWWNVWHKKQEKKDKKDNKEKSGTENAGDGNGRPARGAASKKAAAAAPMEEEGAGTYMPPR